MLELFEPSLDFPVTKCHILVLKLLSTLPGSQPSNRLMSFSMHTWAYIYPFFYSFYTKDQLYLSVWESNHFRYLTHGLSFELKNNLSVETFVQCRVKTSAWQTYVGHCIVTMWWILSYRRLNAILQLLQGITICVRLFFNNVFCMIKSTAL